MKRDKKPRRIKGAKGDTPKGKSRYARKRASGKQMYGPMKTTANHPEFRPGSLKVTCPHHHGVKWNECCGKWRPSEMETCQ